MWAFLPKKTVSALFISSPKGLCFIKASMRSWLKNMPMWKISSCRIGENHISFILHRRISMFSSWLTPISTVATAEPESESWRMCMWWTGKLAPLSAPRFLDLAAVRQSCFQRKRNLEGVFCRKIVLGNLIEAGEKLNTNHIFINPAVIHFISS